MKNIEYVYNVIYYFFYRGSIKMFSGIIYIVTPIVKIFYFFINRIPSIRKYYVTEENDDPLNVAIKRTKKFTENPKLGAGTIYGHGFATISLALLYIGVYHIIKQLLFPTFEDSFKYILIITVILAYATDVIFTQIGDKDVRYIKEFNKKTGWWRVKWSIITALTPFIVIWFSISTSEGGMIGNYLLSLSGNYTYPTAQEKLEQENRMKLIKSGEIKIQPIDVK